jgi:signal peptidase I
MTPVRLLRELLVVLLCAGLAVWGVTRWLVIPFAVEGPSMAPALQDGDRVLVDLWSLRGRVPRPREIVLLSGPGGEDLVKRVAPEPYPGKDTYPPAALKPDSPLEPSFVVLGDNLAESFDSRTFGRVPRHCIRGRIGWRYWPLSRLGSIE